MSEQTTENINTCLTHLEEDTKFSISVDCVIFGYDEGALKVLLIDCNMPPYDGQKSLLGDLLQSTETTKAAARRIVETRTQLKDLYLEQVNVFSQPHRHPLGRVVTIAYYSIIKIEDYTDQIVDLENKRLEWCSLTDINKLAFDHEQILEEAYSCLQKAIREHPIGFSMLPQKFSLIQLQHFYETVLGINLDRRNFQRKLKGLGILKDLEEVQPNVPHRPAKLYSFDNKRYQQNKRKGILSFDS